MHRVRSLPLDVDLTHFSRWLLSQRVQHRISEEHGEQVLWVADVRLVPKIKNALSRYLEDPEFRRQMNDYSNRLVFKRTTSNPLGPAISFVSSPLTFVLLVIALIIAYMTDFGGGGPLLRSLVIVNPLSFPLGDRDLLAMLVDTMQRGEVWRLVTPDFLHFSALHLLFNSLWLWFLGGQLEKSKGSLYYLSGVLAISVFSNIAQYLSTGPAFGGLSGVVYGLVGYCWLWSRKYPNQVFFPPALFAVSVVWLFIGYTPLTLWLGLGKMANDAHLYGLVAGLIWGGITFYLGSKPAVRPEP